MFHFIRHRHHLSLHTLLFRRFVYFSWFYILFSLLTAMLASLAHLKAQFGGWQSNLPVWQDFLLGIGTAISPPLIWLLMLLVLVDITFHHTLAAWWALVFIIIISLLNSLAALLQPLLSQTNLGFIYTLLHLLMVLLPFIMMWLAVDVFLTRIKSRLQT